MVSNLYEYRFAPYVHIRYTLSKLLIPCDVSSALPRHSERIPLKRFLFSGVEYPDSKVLLLSSIFSKRAEDSAKILDLSLNI